MSEDAHAGEPVAVRVRRLEERVIAAGLTSDQELDAILDFIYQNASPLNGARIVARAWTNPGFRQRLLADAGDAFGLTLADGVEVAVWDASAETRYLVVPLRPAGTEGRPEEELARLVTRNGLIGTAAH